MKKEGHSHTQFCPHGDGSKLTSMLEKAIQLGFESYCVTEHAPLPLDFAKNFGGPKEDITTASLTFQQVPAYLALVKELKTKYSQQIEVKVGFELDYLNGYEADRQAFLAKYGSEIDEVILSVHYLEGKDGKFYGIDYSPSELVQGFKPWLTDSQGLYRKYLLQVLASVQVNWQFAKVIRIGHMSLIKKFREKFNLATEFSPANMALIQQILQVMKQRNWQLDFNTAGLRKPYCHEFYPGMQVYQQARLMDIKMCYGSDAHSVTEIGQGYEFFEKIVDK